MHLIISCSLNPNSKSRIMADYANEVYCKNVKLIDLQKLQMPLCDGKSCYDDPIVNILKREIQKASSVLLAGPIYNYDLNAASKNLIELTGSAWNDRLVGFICAAGGKTSYMSPMILANSLMLDFRCIIIPRFVYADKSCFSNGNISDDVKKRIEELVDASIELSKSFIKK